MPTTILRGYTGAFEYEPQINSDTARDGITAFQFSIIGGLDYLNSVFQLDEAISGVPDQPPGNFKVVRRNLEHIAGDPTDGLYRLSVSGEGGTGNASLFISESSYAMQNQQVQGVINLPLAQVPTQYNLIWLYPSVTITTNSQEASPARAEDIANQIIADLRISILKDRPLINGISGPTLAENTNLETVYITGSSVEKAGGLYRNRATVSKGLYLKEQ